MTEKQFLRLRHDICSASEAIILTIVLATVFVSEKWWSFSAFVLFLALGWMVLRVFRKRRIQIEDASD